MFSLLFHSTWCLWGSLMVLWWHRSFLLLWCIAGWLPRLIYTFGCWHWGFFFFEDLIGSTAINILVDAFWWSVCAGLLGIDVGLGAGREGDDRGWDGWMASLTRWTWVWVNSGSWWWTGWPGVLRFVGSQRVRHDWATELNWTAINILVDAFWWSVSAGLLGIDVGM